ncbi:hypothetical protein MRX96_044379 [Rhipicephalus microplus]
MNSHWHFAGMTSHRQDSANTDYMKHIFSAASVKVDTQTPPGQELSASLPLLHDDPQNEYLLCNVDGGQIQDAWVILNTSNR